MLNIGASEFLAIVIAAVIFIGPKDLPLALRTAGRWIGKIRRVSRHFQQGVETMIREAELEEMEKKWREQNAQILAAHPPTPAETDADPTLAGAIPPPAAEPQSEPATQVDIPDEDAGRPAAYGTDTQPRGDSSPELPLSTR